MLQFTAQEMAAIKQKASRSTIEALIKNNEVVLNNDVLVPVDGRATWNLYYFCPEHGVRLTWDRNKPESHCCPVDGKEFTGEPYDGAWWRWLNGLNAKACYDLGLLWHLTDEPVYLEKVREILLAYATYYPDYEVHGGIPYNGPGKANAQTLCEANCHIDLARGYDFIKSALTPKEQEKIEVRLLREGADFLIEHRTDQLHNHEMKINATIGVIGLILDEQQYLDFALNTDYGIHYQLNHGAIGDGMWFEGSIHYHYYALQALQNFEKMACNTPYSVASNPNYLKMMKYPLQLVLNTGDFPRLNDCIAGQEKLTHAHLFEFAYKQHPCDEFASALASIYQNISRDNIDALLYGVDELPHAQPLKCQSTHCPEVGITIELDKARNNAMLLKHAPYGGEHDHYDRLGLILTRGGQEILPDLGTTGYGAELHYGYYKNTATHNTLVVNQQNQSPIDPTLLSYQQGDSFTLVDTLADWTQPEASVDSHTIVQWDSAAYKEVTFRRTMLWLGDLALELNVIGNPHQQQLDLTYHVRGKHKDHEWRVAIDNPLKGALARMKETHLVDAQRSFTQGYKIEGQADYHQHVITDGDVDVLTGYAPDNPATSDLAYTLIRSKQSELKTVVLHDLSELQSAELKAVSWDDCNVWFTIESHGEAQRWRYCFSTCEVTLL
ncbi:alginate lyase [Vibrio astriarenae]|uniref:Alginate lyase n=1 Tax=Vibrio astriarenae TaxID=1481923 RepID=A0A7Z2YG27_9VIBR|nr:heparinase II/III family protein [Vibrio astriarenae]QIA66078.1 alginate lyase [Vibrio astriarenae]